MKFFGIKLYYCVVRCKQLYTKLQMIRTMIKVVKLIALDNSVSQPEIGLVNPTVPCQYTSVNCIER